MEVRARYLLIGFVALVAIAVAFVFVFWMNTTGGLAQRTSYRVQFDAPAAGLYKGSAVFFNGIRVGEVSDVLLDPTDPRRVMAQIAVDARTPVRTDTSVGLSFQGLTGTPAQVDAAAKAYRVPYAKRETPSGYLMDHGRQAYLMGPKGEPIALLPQDQNPQAIVAEIERWIG